MRSLILSTFFILYSFLVFGQLPYTQPQYLYDSLLNVVYGTAIDYSGYEQTLKMDIYKPIGDGNCKRPVILFLHGGAWVVGSKEDQSMKYMARNMAKMGWVTATINYRLGSHKSSNYSMNFLCNSSLSEPCAYICDSAEAIRANYRAMQDAKGAVRFLKNREYIDSLDINNFFIAGESAGAYTSFLVGFLDDDNEKPLLCYEIQDAPTPSSYFNNSHCVQHPLDLTRPDLGCINGDFHLGVYDAKVAGVGSFFGGVFDLNIFDANKTDNPVLYLFAQGSDVIVHYIYDKLFGRIDNECYLNIMCKNYDKYPHSYGNEGIRLYIEENNNLNIEYEADIIYNYSLNGNCIQTGHAIDNPALRLQNMTNFFAEKISESDNNPATNCEPSYLNNFSNLNSINIANNLTNSDFYIHTSSTKNGKREYVIYNSLGIIVKQGLLNNNVERIDIAELHQGIYFVSVNNNELIKCFKLIKN